MNLRKPLSWAAAHLTRTALGSLAGLPASARAWIARTFSRGGADRRHSQPKTDKGA